MKKAVEEKLLLIYDLETKGKSLFTHIKSVCETPDTLKQMM